jgi:hypothetical protein
MDFYLIIRLQTRWLRSHPRGNSHLAKLHSPTTASNTKRRKKKMK